MILPDDATPKSDGIFGKDSALIIGAAIVIGVSIWVYFSLCMANS